MAIVIPLNRFMGPADVTVTTNSHYSILNTHKHTYTPRTLMRGSPDGAVEPVRRQETLDLTT